jgi:hypothetical protein
MRTVRYPAIAPWRCSRGTTPKAKATMWHSSAHVMAEAVEALYPGTKFGIGPAIENGFYYDIDLGERSDRRRRLRGHRGQDEGTGLEEEGLHPHGR